MTRVMSCFACGTIAFDCYQWAIGEKPQSVFSPDAVWLWWLFAAYWAYVAFRCLVWPE